jgi:hypothetical protein
MEVNGHLFFGGIGKERGDSVLGAVHGPGTIDEGSDQERTDIMRKMDLKNRSLDEFFAGAVRVETANSPHKMKDPGKLSHGVPKPPE